MDDTRNLLERLRDAPATRRVAEQALGTALGTIMAGAVLALAAHAAGLIAQLPRPIIGMLLGFVLSAAVLLWGALTERPLTEAQRAEREARLDRELDRLLGPRGPDHEAGRDRL